MKSVSLFLAMLVMVSLMQPVFGIVIDFEDLYPGYEIDSSGDPIFIPSGYAGFNWSADAVCITSLALTETGYEYGTVDHVSLVTGYANIISMADGAFDFQGAYITAAWDNNHQFAVEGWRNGSLVYQSYNITSTDGPYWFDFNFKEIDTLVFDPSGTYLCIDNITLVPEPATLLLLGIGAVIVKKRK